MTFFFQGRKETAPPVASYLLSANFNAVDQVWSDGQVLDTEGEGVQVGSLTAIGGQRYGITGNRVDWRAGSTSGGARRLHATASVSRSIGFGVLFGFDRNVGNVSFGPYGFSISTGASTDEIAFAPYYRENRIRLGGVVFTLVAGNWTDVPGLDQYAIILGGADSFGVPYKPGDSKANFANGSFFFTKRVGDSGWLLDYAERVSATATLYPLWQQFAAQGFLDDLRIPDADLSNLLEPTALDTFTNAEDTPLASHTPDVGGIWFDRDGTFIIQGNRARVGGTDKIAVVDAGTADVVMESVVNKTVNSSRISLAARSNALATKFFEFQLVYGGSPLLRIQENDEGSRTSRGQVAFSPIADNDHRLVVVCDGQSVACYVDDSVSISYGLASFNETETRHGLYGGANQCYFDNFAVYPRGTAGEYADLDNYPGEGN